MKIKFGYLSITLMYVLAMSSFAYCTNDAAFSLIQVQFDDKIHLKGEFFEDTSCKITIADISTKNLNTAFRKSDKGRNNFGYSSSAYWYKLAIVTDSTVPNFVFACENTTINFLDFYLVDEAGNLVKQTLTGNARKYSTREFDNRYFIFDLPLDSNKKYFIYLRVESEDAVDFSIVLAEYKHYFDYQYRLQMLEGIYFGAIIIMGFYNFFLYLAILDLSYLYYVLYIFSTLLFQMELGGWFNQYLMRDFPTISNKMGGVFFCMVLLFIMLFLQCFIGKLHQSKLMKNVFYLIKCFAIGEIMACIFIPLKYNLPIFIVVGVFGVVPSILYTIFRARNQGVSSTRFLLVGWSAISFGGIMYAIASLGLIPFNFLATYSIQIGTILELLFLSFALADRINTLRVEKQIAQRETIHQLQENAILLQKLNEEQKKAFGAVIQGEENERKRLAFELHDGIGQLLSVVKLNLSSLEEWVDKRNRHTAAVISSIVALVDDSCREIRNISHNLMPNTVVQFGLMAALKDFCRKINNAEKIKVHFQNLDFEPELPPQVQTTIYRIIQEIMHNAIRHSQANDVYIQLFQEDYNLVIMIEDNGIGFDTTAIKAAKQGMGIKNIISRIEYLKGEVHLDSYPGKGTTYNIHLKMYQVEAH